MCEVAAARVQTAHFGDIIAGCGDELDSDGLRWRVSVESVGVGHDYAIQVASRQMCGGRCLDMEGSCQVLALCATRMPGRQCRIMVLSNCVE
jgi:hypothetical protein